METYVFIFNQLVIHFSYENEKKWSSILKPQLSTVLKLLTLFFDALIIIRCFSTNFIKNILFVICI